MNKQAVDPFVASESDMENETSFAAFLMKCLKACRDCGDILFKVSFTVHRTIPCDCFLFSTFSQPFHPYSQQVVLPLKLRAKYSRSQIEDILKTRPRQAFVYDPQPSGLKKLLRAYFRISPP
jgi:hypothetical protein